MAMRGAVTRKMWNGAELTVDGSFRQKHTPSGFFAPFDTLLSYPTIRSPMSQRLTTAAATPRSTSINLRCLPPANDRRPQCYKNEISVGSVASAGAAPDHIYAIDQLTTAAYAQPTLTLGGTLTSRWVAAFSATRFAPGIRDPNTAGAPFSNPPGRALDTDETISGRPSSALSTGSTGRSRCSGGCRRASGCRMWTRVSARPLSAASTNATCAPNVRRV